MDDEMMDQLCDAWVRVRDDRNIWVVIITGAGNTAFSRERPFCFMVFATEDAKEGPRAFVEKRQSAWKAR